MRDNLICQTDSYKWTHPSMVPADVKHEYFYLEARTGAGHDSTLWFGLQYVLKRYLEGARVTEADVLEAAAIDAWHFTQPQLPVEGWRRIAHTHGGRLPIRICAAPEGSLIGRGNVVMTIEGTDPQLPWVPGVLESLLLKVWYPTTVATRSFFVRMALERAAMQSSSTDARYMLHDFGYRGCASEESAAIGGAAHLLNFNGTDTLPALRMLREYYGAQPGIAHSVAASQHSVMTSGGPSAEHDIARRIIASHPNQIVSLVADSYDYYKFVDAMIEAYPLVKSNSVRLVIRPDSVTPEHQTPEDLVLWTLARLHDRMAFTVNSKGYVVLPYGVLWGDGLDPATIDRIVALAMAHGYSADNLVFGMGGGLLQKGIDRDTYRWAIKCSARNRGDGWEDVQKMPLDTSKASKAGRFALVRGSDGVYRTEEGSMTLRNVLRPVFENGVILQQETFETVRARAQEALGRELLRANGIAMARI